MKTSIFVLLAGVAALTGCAYCPPGTIAVESQVVREQQFPVNRITKISVVGYGAASSYEKYNDGQKRLMAMRASKLDAYRAVAEQVYGVRVTGGSTVGAIVATNDNFRVSVDAYLRGARVSNITQASDGTFETTMEMDFDESVIRGFIAQATPRSAPVNNATIPSVYGLNRGAFGPGALYGSSFYYAE